MPPGRQTPDTCQKVNTPSLVAAGFNLRLEFGRSRVAVLRHFSLGIWHRALAKMKCRHCMRSSPCGRSLCLRSRGKLTLTPAGLLHAAIAVQFVAVNGAAGENFAGGGRIHLGADGDLVADV